MWCGVEHHVPWFDNVPDSQLIYESDHHLRGSVPVRPYPYIVAPAMHHANRCIGTPASTSERMCFSLGWRRSGSDAAGGKSELAAAGWITTPSLELAEETEDIPSPTQRERLMQEARSLEHQMSHEPMDSSSAAGRNTTGAGESKAQSPRLVSWAPSR